MNHPYAARPEAAKHEWLTPPEIIRALGTFSLDPCSPIGRPWDTALSHYTEEVDGLTCDWNGRVWLNPPYGKHTSAWLKKMASHGNGIALVFARTETRMFFHYVWPSAYAVLFMAGRPSFYHVNGKQAKGNSGGPMVLIAYSDADAEALRVSSIAGKYIRLKEQP